MKQVTPSKGNRGQSLVEFAMTLPLIALILFGIIQYGLIFGAYMTLRNAATVGARYAVIGQTRHTVGEIQDFTKAAVAPMLSAGNVTAVNIDTNFTVGSVSRATSVQIQYNLPLIVPFVVIGHTGNTLSLSAAAVMR